MTNWYDMTLSVSAMEKRGLSEESLVRWLEQNASRSAYGREIGESTGYIHFQVRLVSGLTLDQMLSMWQGLGHVSRSHVKDFDYVLKSEDTWKSWTTALEKYKHGVLREWQKKALEEFSLQTDREILVVIDKDGGRGKSYLARYMEANSIASVIPKMDRAGDMISAVMVKPAAGYVFDIPRSDDKASRTLWSAVEQIKGGHLYDWRYKYQEEWRDPPKIMVMSNVKPPYEALSKDRWREMDISGQEGPQERNSLSLTL